MLRRGERTIEILWLGLGNTRGDAVVFLPKERIVATGDLLVWPVPFMFGSYHAEWPATLAKLDALAADTLFLSHGAPQRDRGYLRQVRDLLAFIRDEALRIRREEELPVYERLGDVRSRALVSSQIALQLLCRNDSESLAEARQLLEAAYADLSRMGLPEAQLLADEMRERGLTVPSI